MRPCGIRRIECRSAAWAEGLSSVQGGDAGDGEAWQAASTRSPLPPVPLRERQGLPLRPPRPLQMGRWRCTGQRSASDGRPHVAAASHGFAGGTHLSSRRAARHPCRVPPSLYTARCPVACLRSLPAKHCF